MRATFNIANSSNKELFNHLCQNRKPAKIGGRNLVKDFYVQLTPIKHQTMQNN